MASSELESNEGDYVIAMRQELGDEMSTALLYRLNSIPAASVVLCFSSVIFLLIRCLFNKF